MRRSLRLPLALPSALLATLPATLLALTVSASAQQSEVVARNGAWTIEGITIPAGSGGEIRMCIASRPVEGGVGLGFIVTRVSVGFLIRLPQARLEAGRIYDVAVAIDGRAPQTRRGRMLSPDVLSILDEGRDVQRQLAAFSRGRTATFQSEVLGATPVSASLTGSTWAINTLAGCRAAHVE